MKLPIVGIMRFSLVTERNRSNFKATAGLPLADNLSLILHPERLEERISLLEAMALRSFDHQTDPDFKLIIMTSKSLPKYFKNRLRKIADSRPYIIVKTVIPEKSIQDAARGFVREFAPDRQAITFRIDDDDALFPAFISSLRELAEAAAPSDIITFERGVYIEPEGQEFLIQDRVFRNIAIGLATHSNDGSTIFDRGSHMNLGAFNARIDTRPQAWIRLLHPGNDSGARINRAKPFERVPVGDVSARLPAFRHLDFPAVHRALKASALAATGRD